MSVNKSQWAAKHAEIDAVARGIIDEETRARDAKTAHLKALREARDGAATGGAKSPAAKAKPQTKRAMTQKR